MKPTLLVLAAGMGSRYGSLKQMDAVGPNGETIIDYSVYDAIRAGFGKIVFVIRGSFAKEFKEVFNKERFGNNVEVDYVMQELENIPAGCEIPLGREKPWGTAHAVMMATPVIKEPFAVVNADDFYGQNAIEVMGKYLSKLTGKKNNYSMVGYEVNKTLSENGAVSRGICALGRCSNLAGMVERTKIERQGDKIVYTEDNEVTVIDDNTPVSMNLFGFTPDFFAHSEDMFKGFLDGDAKSNLKAEFYIPLVVNKLIEDKIAAMKVLKTTSNWFGVTYKEDRPTTVARIGELIAEGVYPAKLW